MSRMGASLTLSAAFFHELFGASGIALISSSRLRLARYRTKVRSFGSQFWSFLGFDTHAPMIPLEASLCSKLIPNISQQSVELIGFKPESVLF